MATYYQRITVLLNPRAGKQDATAQQVADAFRAAGAEVDMRLAEGPAIAQEAADAVRRGSRVVVAGGGDGTIASAAGALAGTGAGCFRSGR
jgi:diacylglycerol kinase family enzyme